MELLTTHRPLNYDKAPQVSKESQAKRLGATVCCMLVCKYQRIVVN